jgi:integrase
VSSPRGSKSRGSRLTARTARSPWCPVDPMVALLGKTPGTRFMMLRTKSGLPKHCAWNTDQHGRKRPLPQGWVLRLFDRHAMVRRFYAPIRGGARHHSWTEGEIAQFERRHAIGSKARLALALGLYTAQRKGDVLRMCWQHVSGDCITVRQEKTDTALLIPMHPQLVAVLASVPRSNLTFLMTEHGAPFTSNGFGNWFRDRCNEAGLSQCPFHGLRKAAATRLANAGCSVDQVKAITGHRSLAEVARYTKAADQRRLARQALDIQLKTEGEQRLSNLDTRLDKTGSK